jgi:hypothetical protein
VLVDIVDVGMPLVEERRVQFRDLGIGQTKAQSTNEDAFWPRI